MTVPLLRGILAGLLAFMLFGWLFARVVSALTPGEWSVDALNLAGLAALVVDGAVGGAVGAWQSSRAGLRGPAALLGAVLGPLIATLAIIASEPDASLWTISAVVIVIAAAGAAGHVTLRSLGPRPRGSRHGSARSRPRA